MCSCPSCEGFIAKIKEGRGDHIKSGQRLPRLQHFPSSCKKLIWSNMAHIKHLQHLPPKRTVSIKEHWPMHFRTSYESAKLPTAQQKVFKVKKLCSLFIREISLVCLIFVKISIHINGWVMLEKNLKLPENWLKLPKLLIHIIFVDDFNTNIMT